MTVFLAYIAGWVDMGQTTWTFSMAYFDEQFYVPPTLKQPAKHTPRKNSRFDASEHMACVSFTAPHCSMSWPGYPQMTFISFMIFIQWKNSRVVSDNVEEPNFIDLCKVWEFHYDTITYITYQWYNFKSHFENYILFIIFHYCCKTRLVNWI